MSIVTKMVTAGKSSHAPTRALPTALAAALLLTLSAVSARAGYLDVSTNWDAVSTVPMSKRAAIGEVGKCKTVQAYQGMGGQAGAVIVAGPHTTDTDNKLHLTVRLYDTGGNHQKSCHVYVGKNNAFTSCSCNNL